jgi:hypothetical protein
MKLMPPISGIQTVYRRRWKRSAVHQRAQDSAQTDNEHKKRRFPAIDFRTALLENEALAMKDAIKRATYQKEYERRAALYYQGQPPFDEVLAVIERNLVRL